MKLCALLMALAVAAPAAAEAPAGDAFPDSGAARLEEIDDYQNPDERAAWFDSAWTDPVMNPWQDLKDHLNENYGIDFFIAYSPQQQFGAWKDNSDHFAHEADLIGEWRLMDSEDYGKGRFQYWFLHVQTWGKNRGAEFQKGAGSAWELNDIDTSRSDTLNAIGMLWWEHLLFEDRVRLVLGKIYPAVVVGTNRFLGDDRTEFNMETLGIDPVMTVGENRALGAFLQLRPFGGFYVSGLWVDADSNTRSLDFRSVNNGDYGWVSEVGWEGEIEGLGEGNYRALYFHSDSTGSEKDGSKGDGGNSDDHAQFMAAARYRWRPR